MTTPTFDKEPLSSILPANPPQSRWTKSGQSQQKQEQYKNQQLHSKDRFDCLQQLLHR